MFSQIVRIMYMQKIDENVNNVLYTCLIYIMIFIICILYAIYKNI